MDIIIFEIVFIIVLLLGVLGFTVFFHLFKTYVEKNITRENGFSDSKETENSNEDPIKYE